VTDDQETKSMPPTAGSSVQPEPASFQLNPGDRVGNYVIREQIGEGGFAIVYAAEQEKPVRRKVALKIIKLGMDTKQVIARFEAEKQALAMMDHPNVAKVFDAGSTETGRPYFVMEHVPGDPITDYCDRHRLTTDQRLDLFIQVCEAVQHAHQKGIIHRDIKPSNVLVAVKEDQPQVKVIDFGVSKAISQRLTEKTIYTEQGQFIGTPEYMSPEQAEMGALDIDTRTDIYSLGVVLYELLIGALPFDPTTLRQAGFAEIQRIIREQEPPKPSTRLSDLGEASSDVAQRHDSDPKTLLRELRGDLDWIAMKALEKDRTRRYATASELAAEVRRYRDGDPVQARKPSFGYVFGKLLQKERGKVAVALLALAALLIGAAGLAWHMERTRWDPIMSARAITLIEKELANWEQEYVDLKENPPADLEALLKDPRTAYILRGHRTDQPQTDVEVLNDLLRSEIARWPDVNDRAGIRFHFSGLDQVDWRRAVTGLADHAIRHVRESLGWSEWYTSFIDSETAGVLAATERREEPSTLEQVNLSSRSPDNLIALRDELVDSARILGGPRSFFSIALTALAIVILGTAASIRWGNPKVQVGMGLIGAVVWFGVVFYAGADGFANAGFVLLILGMTAVPLLRDIAQRDWPILRFGIAGLALGLWGAVLILFPSLLQSGSPWIVIAVGAVGIGIVVVLLIEMWRLWRHVWHIQRQATTSWSPRKRRLHLVIGILVGGTLAPALVWYMGLFDLMILNDVRRDSARNATKEASAAARDGHFDEAQRKYVEALELRRRLNGDTHASVVRLTESLGWLYARHGRYEAAEPLLRESYHGHERISGSTAGRTLDVLTRLALVLQRQEKYDEAQAAWREALEICNRQYAEEDRLTLRCMNGLGRTLIQQDQFKEAEPLLRKLLGSERQTLSANDPRLAQRLIQLGMTLHGLDRHAEAEPLLRECVQIRQIALPEGDWLTFNAMSVFGECLSHQGRFAEAEPLLLQGFEQMSPPTVVQSRKGEALQRVIDLYEAWDKPDKSAEWRAKLPTEQDAVASDPPAVGKQEE